VGHQKAGRDVIDWRGWSLVDGARRVDCAVLAFRSEINAEYFRGHYTHSRGMLTTSA
jgi:hypothetical protein